jgi:choice-of-anchor B domain-containing protein
MKRSLLALLIVTCFIGKSQSYSSFRIDLVSLVNPQSNVGIGSDQRKYSGCWGWYQASKNKEYAIVGSSAGTFFLDISNPGFPIQCDFVEGKSGCTWREMKTYQNYCYVVSDDSSPNRFQIIDMQYLPDSVHVVHDGTTYFERGHTIWIDKDKMYIGSETQFGGSHQSMTIYSLATPTNPTLLRSLKEDAPFISVVHDMYVNNDTVFASCGNQGLYIFKYNSAANTFTQLGSYANYSSGAAYNHASALTADKKTLVFCDEVPYFLPIRIVDVQNPANIIPQSTINPYQYTTPHNPYMIGSRWAIISCYEDGLNIYDISDPASPVFAGFFDTHPQGGINANGAYNGYRGNWGAYPFFPSGLILALDMQNGVFILDASKTYIQPVGFTENAQMETNFQIYPSPASNHINITSAKNENAAVSVLNILGETVLTQQLSIFGKQKIDVSNLANGAYFVNLKTDKGSLTKKIIINNN